MNKHELLVLIKQSLEEMKISNDFKVIMLDDLIQIEIRKNNGETKTYNIEVSE